MFKLMVLIVVVGQNGQFQHSLTLNAFNTKAACDQAAKVLGPLEGFIDGRLKPQGQPQIGESEVQVSCIADDAAAAPAAQPARP